MDVQKTRDEILVATLDQVVFDGWTRKALKAGVAEAGYPEDMALRAFPGGVVELAEHFSDYADRRMTAALEGLDLDGLRVHERVAAAVRARLEPLGGHREAMRRLLSFLALPTNAVLAARSAYRTVSAIWYAAGDEATDFSYYTKRALLAPVYTATVFYWLADESEDFADTWDFLDRRLADVLMLPKAQARMRAAFAGMPTPLRAFRQAARGWAAGRFGD
jgi:ubiquinone biosynthesis protein COQ9